MGERRTKKFVRAWEVGSKLGLHRLSRDKLYERLQREGYNWDAKSKTWSKSNPWTGSAFQNANDAPTGHVKVRVMAHPDEVEHFIGLVCEKLIADGAQVEQVSDAYPNRKGPGVRVYIDAIKLGGVR